MGDGDGDGQISYLNVSLPVFLFVMRSRHGNMIMCKILKSLHFERGTTTE